jgi:alkaline phosphatase D
MDEGAMSLFTFKDRLAAARAVESISRDRRRALGLLGGAIGAAAFIPGLARTAWALGEASSSGLFTLGVASGDPTAASVVLWTRLAPDPLNGGGMGRASARVDWQVATDPAMTNIVKAGAVEALARDGHAVNVQVSGLGHDRWYYFRFGHRGAWSRIGRTRTFPARNVMPSQMRFAFASCQDYEAGYYAAWRDVLMQEALDFVVFLGDYIYEYGPDASLPAERRNNGPETVSVVDYRNRYALYRLDPDLQAIHAAVPFIATFDDHEVDNNFAGRVPEDDQTRAAFRARMANAFRVYRESMPVLPSVRARASRINLFRRLDFGRLAAFNVLDTRQYRSDQVCGDGLQVLQACPDMRAADTTLLGAVQEQWLQRNLRFRPSLWNVIAQQVMMMRWDLGALAGPGLNLFNVDAWDGYQVARDRLLQFLARNAVPNPVVLTGDIHSSWAADLKADFADPASPIVGSEFVCTSISSVFGDANDGLVKLTLPTNPHIRHFDGLHRGYALCTVTPARWQTEFRAVNRVASPFFTVPAGDIPVTTLRSFAVNVGQPGLVPVL